MHRPLNRSQMPSTATVQIRDFEEEARNAGKPQPYLVALKESSSAVRLREKNENGFRYGFLQSQRGQEMEEQRQKMRGLVGGLRPAGLSSINPTLGTVGASEDLVKAGREGLRGGEMLDRWRKNAPWAFDASRNKMYDPRNDPY